MAVTAVLKRTHVLRSGNGTTEVGTATLSGTYATGGFTFALGTLSGTAGTSPYGGLPLFIQWFSPSGYIYVSVFNGQSMVTKIFSAPGTELANNTAVPDTSVQFTLTRRWIS
jgi:hypothetical protein